MRPTPLLAAPSPRYAPDPIRERECLALPQGRPPVRLHRVLARGIAARAQNAQASVCVAGGAYGLGVVTLGVTQIG
jgi:hypothetical protein